MKLTRVFSALNWSRPDDSYSETFRRQNHKQFWLPEEVSLSNDRLQWGDLSDKERDTYVKVLGGLTLLDTIQGEDGMPSVIETVTSHQQKAVLSFMAGMENSVHATSYSHIFMSLEKQSDIDELFKWIETNPELQRKANLIVDTYQHISKYTEETPELESWFAKVGSVALESFLFYSGFFYPLYHAGHGRLRGSGEIISLIIRDESIHGVYVGLIAQEELKKFDDSQKKFAEHITTQFFKELIEIEKEYSKALYSELGLYHDVMDFVKYNANKAMNNLGFDSIFEHEPVNSIILNGLITDGSHDFFSQKSASYSKATVETTSDDDFNF